MDIYDLYKLPMKRLLREGSVLAIWVTNRPKFQDFVKNKLFQSWGVEHITDWTWLKVTSKGDWLFPLKEG
jgi:N6-adenosine-specific RNA methylase IME4